MVVWLLKYARLHLIDSFLPPEGGETPNKAANRKSKCPLLLRAEEVWKWLLRFSGDWQERHRKRFPVHFGAKQGLVSPDSAYRRLQLFLPEFHGSAASPVQIKYVLHIFFSFYLHFCYLILAIGQKCVFKLLFLMLELVDLIFHLYSWLKCIFHVFSHCFSRNSFRALIVFVKLKKMFISRLFTCFSKVYLEQIDQETAQKVGKCDCYLYYVFSLCYSVTVSCTSALDPNKWTEFKLQDSARVTHNTNLFR